MTTLPSLAVLPRDRILEKSRRVVRGYVAARDNWNLASSLSAILGQMQREYEGRFLYELIQNAYDAHPAGDKGDIVVLLDVDEGEHGLLYVANGGTPFTEKNFEAICELARSDKTPDESIGNKGVGFKSILQVCQWPEIYSAADGDQGRFGGYCFTFARPEQYCDLVDGDAELAAQMQDDVSPYFLPVPLEDQAQRVLEFASRGFATVIRLPIKSESAREVVVERVAGLLDEEVPIHLFLQRLQSLEISQLDTASGNQSKKLLRHAIVVDDPVGDPDQRYEQVELGDQGQWFVSNRRVSAKVMRDAIAESIHEGQLDESWGAWSRDAWVSVAVRTDGLQIEPRLYTFLPMEREAAAPLHGHVHAPFSTLLARTSVNEQVVLNSRLLDCAARAATAGVLTFRDNEEVLPATALVDLLAWQSDHHDRVTQSFSDAGSEMESLEVVPIEPLLNGRRRAAFKSTYVWSYPAVTLLDHSRMARDAGAELVSSAITGDRMERLDAYCQGFFASGFKPDATLRAEWIESVAGKLHQRRSAPKTWDRFYGELAQVFEHEADALRGRSILLGDDGKLHPSPPDDGDEGHPFVFFPPAYERTDEDEEVEGDVDLKPPAALRHALVLMNEGLTWTRQEGRTRRSTSARRFLEGNKLVRRFKTVDLLEHVGRALGSSRRADLSRDALRFTFSLVGATRSLRQRDLHAVGLRVPTVSGWRLATEAVFSPGWETALGASLSELITRASVSSSELAAVGDAMLKEPAEWPTAVEDLDAWRSFLAEIGVRDGLWPRPVTLGEDSLDGSNVRPQTLGRRLGLTPVDQERWVQAVTAIPEWMPNHPQTPYRPRSAVSVLPGQADYEALDHRARALFADLVVAGLESWPDGALEITWYRFRHQNQQDERRWPSPIAAFLSETLWLPVSEPGQRRDESFVVPREAWYFSESSGEEQPYFSALVIGRVRRRISAADQALSRLRKLGMGEWGEPADVPRLLHHLAELIDSDSLSETGLLPFHRAYQGAWSRATKLEVDRFITEAGDLPIVVSCAGQLAVLRPSDGPEMRVYLLGDGGSLAARIVEASDLPMLKVDDADEGQVRSLLVALLQERLVTAEQLEIEVVTDAGSFTPDGSGELLVADDRHWLDTLLALILETQRSRSGQLGPRRRREVYDRLLRVRLLETQVLELRIGVGAASLPERHRLVVPLDDEHHPTLIVASDADASQGTIERLLPIAGALCELLQIGSYEDRLLLALERLHGQRCTSPTDEDLARVVGIDATRVAEIRSVRGSSVDRMVRMLVPLVAYHVDVPHAVALLDVRDSVETEDDLVRVIAEITPNLPDLERSLAASREAESPSSMRDALGLDYGRFNSVLGALAPDYEVIHNNAGHTQAMGHHVQTNRSRLLRELRGRYLALFRNGAPLDTYVAARELEIPPDPAWLDSYDLPPEHLLHARALSWLDEHGTPSGDAVGLPDIDVARAENRRLIASVAGTAARLVPAWARKHRVPLPAVWSEESVVQSVMTLAGESGFLDFEMLDETRVLIWFGERGWWPEAMPTTLIASAVGLGDADLASAADLQERERQERLRRRRVLSLDNVEFSTEPNDYAAIFEHVTGTLREDLLATSRAARLQEMTEVRAGRSSGGGGGPRRLDASMSDSQKSAIGLIGETIAYAWLQRRYRDMCSPVSWVSSYRETIGEPPGDDSLGYDFKITLSQTTLYFEIKATSETSMRFELGETEVRKAAECVRRRRDDYRIIFLTNVLDADARKLHILRNPMDPKYQRFYNFPGAGLVCTFNLV